MNVRLDSPTRFLCVAAILGLSLASSQSLWAAPVTLTFDAPTPPFIPTFTEGNYIATGSGGTMGHFPGRNCFPACASNGTYYLSANPSAPLGNADTISITALDGSSFTFDSFSGAETIVPNQFPDNWASAIQVTGVRNDTTTVSETFTIDRVNDGPGGVADFEMFSSSFTGSFVELQFSGVAAPFGGRDFSIDNVTIDPGPVNGTSGDDTLTVDLTANTYSLDGGVTQTPFSGDLDFIGGLGNDTLIVNGGAGTSAAFSFLNANDGDIVVDGRTISYTGLEPIIFDMDVQQLVFDYTSNGVDSVLLSDDSTPADGISRIDSTAGELVEFASANVQIIDILLNEADSFSNTGLDSSFDGTVNVVRDMQNVPIPPITLLLGAGIAGIGFQRCKQIKAR